jgi:hypothetical protein
MKFKIEVCKTETKIILLELVDEDGIRIEFANRIKASELETVEYPLLIKPKPDILLIKSTNDLIAIAATIAHYSRFVPAIGITDTYFHKAVIIHSINSHYAVGTDLPLSFWGSGTPHFARKEMV